MNIMNKSRINFRQEVNKIGHVTLVQIALKEFFG